MIIIIGSNGYLGARIASFFSKNSVYVIGLQRKSIKKDKAKININNFLELRSVNFLDLSGLSNLINEFRPKLIINAAGPSASFCQENELKVLNDCNEMYVNLSKSINESNHRPKIVNFSTVHVYSDSLMGKYDENSATRNSHPYAKYHLLREEILNNQFSSEFINLRLSNGVGVPVYRDNACWTLMINDFIRSAIKTKTINVRSNIHTLRDYFSISDLESFLFNLYQSKLIFNKSTFNFSSGKSTSIKEALEKIIRILRDEVGIIPEINYENKNHQAHDKFLEINNDRIRKKFNFNFNEIDKELTSLVRFCSINYKHR